MPPISELPPDALPVPAMNGAPPSGYAQILLRVLAREGAGWCVFGRWMSPRGGRSGAVHDQFKPPR